MEKFVRSLRGLFGKNGFKSILYVIDTSVDFCGILGFCFGSSPFLFFPLFSLFLSLRLLSYYKCNYANFCVRLMVMQFHICKIH